MKRLLCILMVIVTFMSVTACAVAEQEETTMSEQDIASKIKCEDRDLGTFDSGTYNTMYVLGTEGELCLFGTIEGKSFILGDNPEKGNHYYEEISLEKDMKPIGVSVTHVIFEDASGKKWGIMTVNDARYIRVGEGINVGDVTATYFEELTPEEKSYIPIAYETDIPER